jgi:transposase
MSAGYENAIRAAVPRAEVCFDPFHVVIHEGAGRVKGRSRASGGLRPRVW